MVVVVEIFRRNFLASMVPVIVNAVLNEHQLVIDIVAFVIKGDFHRSRLGEKQRGKVLAGWVTRKMRTIAQYSIRDPNGSDNQITEEPAPVQTRTGTSKSGGPGSVKGSLRGSMLGMTAQMQNLQLQTGQEMAGQQQMNLNLGPPAGLSEMPAQPYHESIPERAELAAGSFDEQRDGNDNTPTEARKEFPPHLTDNSAFNYSPVDRQGVFDDETLPNDYHQQYGATGLSTSPLPTILRPGVTDDTAGPPEPHYSNKPFLNVVDGQMQGDGENTPQTGDRWSLPSQQAQQGGLRVANRASNDGDEAWAKEAIMHMNFAGAGPDEMRRLS